MAGVEPDKPAISTTVYHNHRDSLIVGLFYNRSDGFGFIRSNDQQVYSFLHETTNVLFLLYIIIFDCTYLHFHSIIKKGFAQHFVIHLMTPLIIATLGNTNTEMRLAVRARTQRSQKHEPKK